MMRNPNHIIVRSEGGQKVLEWWTPLFGRLSVQEVGRRIVIKKTTWFNSKTYITSLTESVELRRW